MKIYTALVTHKYGTNSYVAKTQVSIRRKVANYCREWWNQAFDGDERDPSCQGKNLTDMEIIDAYFDKMSDIEDVEFGEDDLTD